MPDERDNIVVPVIREEAHASTVPVQTGAVRVVKTRETHDELIEQELRKGRAEVRRVSTNRVVDGPQPPRREGNTLIIPVVSEVLNGCEKQWVVTEEIHVTRLETAETVQQNVQLATEQARVERLDEHGRVVATEEAAETHADAPAARQVAPETPVSETPVPESPATGSILESRKAGSARSPKKKILSSTDSILRERLPKDRR